jgi:alanyl-tRNA synthetase
MTSEQIRERFLKFFEERGHEILPSASLIPPEEDNSSSAGVQPLAPFILGEPHPLGKRIVNIQKCVRVQDINEVGDNTHDTFFEMMGNWSFNDYFKEDAIKWSYELLTNKEKGFGLDPERLYITVFEGDANAPKDTESYEIWKKYMPESRIYFMPAKSNWWSAGDNGPCGPDTEMFYDITPQGLGELTKEEYIIADEEQKVVEIWNDVFMQYLKKEGKVVGKLDTHNVDTGSGLERIVMAVQGKDNIFDTDLFMNIMEVASHLAEDMRSRRIIADHIRTAVFMIADGVAPSNSGRGYILRRLLRRAIMKSANKNFDAASISVLVNAVIEKYQGVYTNVYQKRQDIKKTIEEENNKFSKTIKEGLREFEKGIDPFILFTRYGFPLSS